MEVEVLKLPGLQLFTHLMTGHSFTVYASTISKISQYYLIGDGLSSRLLLQTQTRGLFSRCASSQD